MPPKAIAAEVNSTSIGIAPGPCCSALPMPAIAASVPQLNGPHQVQICKENVNPWCTLWLKFCAQTSRLTLVMQITAVHCTIDLIAAHALHMAAVCSEGLFLLLAEHNFEALSALRFVEADSTNGQFLGQITSSPSRFQPDSDSEDLDGG